MTEVLKPGSVFGSYCLLRRLARGGMGEIWLAERRGEGGFQKRVVVKTILEVYSEDPELISQFLREGNIAAGLNHPAIAQTFDLGKSDSIYFIAMEFVQGRDLRELLVANVEIGKLIPLNLVMRIMAEACGGLYYAHTWKTPEGRTAPIVHRDISPQNILVTYDGGVKIVDFGIAKAAHLASRTRSGVLKGKYAYMSPEQVKGREVDGRSDIFSLGIVMYEMVTGRRLFKRDSEMSTLEAVVRAEIPPPHRIEGSVPPEVEALLMRALRPDPLERFSDAREMQLEIEQTMLVTGLTASSAHLSAYMSEFFPASEESSEVARMRQRLDHLAGVKEKSKFLERTSAYRLPSDDRRELTHNLIAAASRRRRRKNWFPLLASLGALAVGGLSWWGASALLDGGGSDVLPQIEPARPEAEPAIDAGATVPAAADAGAVPQPPPEDTEPADAGAPAGAADTRPDKRPVVRAESGARLSITADPRADILLNGKKLGKGKLTARAVKPGRHRLEVRLPEGGHRAEEIVLRPGEHLNREFVLASGTLRLVVLPWAEVFLGEKRLGETPMPPLNLPEGTYSIKLVNSSLGKSETREVRIRPGKESRLHLDWR